MGLPSDENFVPAVGTRWRYGVRGGTYEIIDGGASPGYVLARGFSEATKIVKGTPIELRLTGFQGRFIQVIPDPDGSLAAAAEAQE